MIDFYFPVPYEATAFLAAVSAFAVLLFIIFVYVNKKWRIVNVGFHSQRPVGRAPVLKQQEGDGVKRCSPFRHPLGMS
jgi:hypothetical protein